MLHPVTIAILSMVLDRPLTTVQWGGLLGLVQTYAPSLYNLLYKVDVDSATLLFANDDGRTISWQIATRAQAGDPLCIALCAELNLLSPNHCQNTLAGTRFSASFPKP